MNNEIHITGNLTPLHLAISNQPSNLLMNDSIEQRIDAIWDEKLIESRKRGKEIFNGESYRINDWSFAGGVLQLEMAKFDYKHRLGLTTMTSNGEIDLAVYPQSGTYVSTTVRTSDGKYVLVKLSGKSMNDNHIEMIGGMVETETPFSGKNFLFDVLYQELEEEAGVQISDIDSCVLRAFFSTKNAHYGFYFETTLQCTSQELQNRFTNNTDIDIAELLFFSKEAYVRAFSELGNSKQILLPLVMELP